MDYAGMGQIQLMFSTRQNSNMTGGGLQQLLVEAYKNIFEQSLKTAGRISFCPMRVWFLKLALTYMVTIF